MGYCLDPDESRVQLRWHFLGSTSNFLQWWTGFERCDHTRSWMVLHVGSRLNVKQNFDWLSCTKSSCSSLSAAETANGDGHQSPCVWTWSESKFCYHARTKGKNSKWCSSAQKWPQKPSQSIKFRKNQSTRLINNSPCAIVLIRPCKVVFLFLVLQVT